MFVTEALAQTTTATPAGSLIGSFLPIIAIILVMYILVFRPQRKAMREREQMLANVKRGDIVVTGGGLVGKVTHVHEDIGEVDVDLDGTKVRAVRAMLADVRTKDATKKQAPAANDTAETEQPKVKSRTRR